MANFPKRKKNPKTKTEKKCKKNSLMPPPPKKKSSWYDEITSKILKACASLISHSLSYVYNHSLCTGIFPDHLKIAVVKPLCKKGDKTSIKNYRPILLLMGIFLRYLRKPCTVD